MLEKAYKRVINSSRLHTRRRAVQNTNAEAPLMVVDEASLLVLAREGEYKRLRKNKDMYSGEVEGCPVVAALEEFMEYIRKQPFYEEMDKNELRFILTNIIARYRTK